MSRSLASFAMVGAVALTLSACSALPGASELDPAKSPLSEYFSAIYGDGSDESEWQDKQNQVEELVAECMTEEGFEYVPVDYSQQGGSSFSGAEWKPEDEEWVAQYGYGFVNYPGRTDEPVIDDEWVDPNQDYVMSLSESEQAAYYETLYGPGPTEDQLNEDGSYEYNWEEAGCQGAASNEVYGSDPFQDEKHKPVQEAMTAMYENIQKDPRMVALDAEWASCMADGGFTEYTSKMDAQNKFIDELNAFYESKPEGAQPDDPELKELGEREIKVAVADLACAKKMGYQQKSLEVQFEAERQFIQDHKAELDALLADAEQGK